MASNPLAYEFTSPNANLLVTLTEIAGNAIQRPRLTEQMVQHAAELELRVTERMAEIQNALQKAQAADRLKSEFTENVNHDLRTPLINLVHYYQMLRTQPSVKTEERLDVIGREPQRLRALIEQLLNLSRFDLVQVTLRPVQCDLNKLIQTLVMIVGFLQKNATLNWISNSNRTLHQSGWTNRQWFEQYPISSRLK